MVIERVSVRVFQIDVNGKIKNVSIENIKPAHFVPYDEWITLNKTKTGTSFGAETILKTVPKIESKLYGQPIFNIKSYATQEINTVPSTNNRCDNSNNVFQNLSDNCTTTGTITPASKIPSSNVCKNSTQTRVDKISITVNDQSN